MSQFQFPLPIAVNAVVRACAVIAAPLAAGLKALARGYANRQQARALAGLDRLMLADIGINHSDLRDALSQPIWQDPTALLSERATERRRHRKGDTNVIAFRAPRATDGFHRPPTDRPARQTI